MEKTLVIIKPDGMKKNLTAEIICRICSNGMIVSDAKMIKLNERILKEHYSHLADKPFFNDIVEYMTSSNVLVMIVEGEDSIFKMRELAGSTDPKEADKGTIRYDYAESKSHNIIHTSDCKENADTEINRFFK